MNMNNPAAMAANVQQMAGGGPGRGRPQNQQLSQLCYQQIMTHNTPALPWHSVVNPPMRVGNAMNVITNGFLAMPHIDNNQIISQGLAFERDAWSKCFDKGAYDSTINSRVSDLFKQRQLNERKLQSTLNAQAAAQAPNQSQMMMNHNMQMRNAGHPMQQGFQNLQQQGQPDMMNQQGQPVNMMGNANGLPINPNQQAMQAANQIRNQLALQANMMGNLPPQERQKLNLLVQAKMGQVQEPNRSNYRAALSQKFGAHMMAQLQQQGLDPLVYFFQTQALQQITKGAAGTNQAGLQMQPPQQRAMNQPPQQLPVGPNGEFGSLANVESIMNQQKAGLMAQEAGQMVVPASNGAGRNATPQPMGSMPGSNQGAGQPNMPHHLQQQFNHQPNQQLKLDQRAADQRAAQSQAQIRAQAQSKQLVMNGQQNGLNGQGAASQSPAMNTLNAPVRRTPIGIGQMEGFPQMGQGNAPFGGMDPRFSQPGQQTPMGPNGAMNRNQFFQSVLAQMPEQIRAQVLQQPAEKIPEMILKWNANRGASTPMGPRPQLPNGQLGPGNPMGQPMNQLAPGGNGPGQHPNMGTPMSQQNQFLMQQQMNRLRNPNGPQGPVDHKAIMDNMPIPAKIMEQLRQTQGGISPDVKKWGQLKQWMANKGMTQQQMGNLHQVQSTQYQHFIKNSAAMGADNPQMSQPHMQQQGMPQNGQGTPQMSQPGMNAAGSMPNIIVTPQELQSARNHERFKNVPDDKLRQMVYQMKVQSYRNRLAGQAPGPPTQAPQASQPGPATTAAGPSQAPQGPTAPPRQQNAAGQETGATSPAVQGRGVKQGQNNRPAPTMPPAPAPAKAGTKRPHPDDTPDAPNPSNNPIQRPSSQQAQPGASSTPSQVPQLSSEQLAAMNPEQRQKYEALVRSRQPQVTTEQTTKLKKISKEVSSAEWRLQLPDIPMTPEQHREAGHKIDGLKLQMNKMMPLLTRWYQFVQDDGRAALYFKLRARMMKQYVDADKLTILKDRFTMAQSDMDSVMSLLESMRHDLEVHMGAQQKMKRNPSQQNAAEPAAPQVAPTRPGAAPSHPAPLNAANLEKQNALNQIQMHRRNSSKAGQPPPPPTTEKHPFSFGAQSPDGQPKYAGQPKVTQDNLQLPARKKPKTEVKAGAGVNQGVSSAHASPQGQKSASPELSKRQPASETRPPMSQFRCTDPHCDLGRIGFPTAEALQKHTLEEHIKPAQDPLQFASDALADVLGLGANGKFVNGATAGAGVRSAGDMPKLTQTPPIKVEMENARDVAMQRQGSTTGSKPNQLNKTTTGKAGTPKPEAIAKPSDSVTPVGGENKGTTIDPQALMFAVTGLETGGNGSIMDMNVYRSLALNDTPESSKDSAGSERNSDVSEGVALNVTLDMGIGTWEPFGPGPDALEATNIDLGSYGDLTAVPYPDFTWDDVNNDFDKPFFLDTSLFSLEAAN
ncbi:hypothetical protein F4808DRAFT_127937 [Astrocystis sublimbata]|nr:hypothetical protein F4808DRAFT_127937 [Astrocystis sublimbata]